MVVADAATGTERTVTIPSFHRPSIINYLINQEDDWSDAAADTEAKVTDIVEAIRRATFRPIPLHADWNGGAMNSQFTGGSIDFALASPNFIAGGGATNLVRLDLLVNALCNGPWDVDNDGDGIADSIWVDLGLPVFTSREGKLLRPLIAPMIEDTSGKLNLNAHGNYSQLTDIFPEYRDNLTAHWAQATLVPTDPLATTSYLFRGQGYGPAEIALSFEPTGGGLIPGGAPILHLSEITSVMSGRNYVRTASGPYPPAGRDSNDFEDVLLHGQRESFHSADWTVRDNVITKNGFSMDPNGCPRQWVCRGPVDFCTLEAHKMKT